MTAFGPTGANDLDSAFNDENDVHDEEKPMDNADCSQIGRIGTVAKGSLEEEIWRELGALPPSRRLDLPS